jgi:hypothetical protein
VKHEDGPSLTTTDSGDFFLTTIIFADAITAAGSNASSTAP